MPDEKRSPRDPIVVVAIVGFCAFASFAIAALPFLSQGVTGPAVWAWAVAVAAPSMMGGAIGVAYYLTRPRSGQ